MAMKARMFNEMRRSFSKKVGKNPLVCEYCGKQLKSKSDFQWHIAIHPCQIIDGLYLGNSGNAKDLKLLKKIGITHVLNVANDVPLFHTISFVACKHIKIVDSDTQSLIPYFEPAFEFIDSALANHVPSQDRDHNNTGFYHKTGVFGNNRNKKKKHLKNKVINENYSILVHCHMGVSRSVSFVIGYLMSRLHLSLDKAYKLVKKRRIVSNPINFMPELMKYEKRLQLIETKMREIEKMESKSPNKSDLIDSNSNVEPLISYASMNDAIDDFDHKLGIEGSTGTNINKNSTNNANNSNISNIVSNSNNNSADNSKKSANNNDQTQSNAHNTHSANESNINSSNNNGQFMGQLKDRSDLYKESNYSRSSSLINNYGNSNIVLTSKFNNSNNTGNNGMSGRRSKITVQTTAANVHSIGNWINPSNNNTLSNSASTKITNENEINHNDCNDNVSSDNENDCLLSKKSSQIRSKTFSYANNANNTNNKSFRFGMHSNETNYNNNNNNSNNSNNNGNNSNNYGIYENNHNDINHGNGSIIGNNSSNDIFGSGTGNGNNNNNSKKNSFDAISVLQLNSPITLTDI